MFFSVRKNEPNIVRYLYLEQRALNKLYEAIMTLLTKCK